jgi:hypothetical protein
MNRFAARFLLLPSVALLALASCARDSKTKPPGAAIREIAEGFGERAGLVHSTAEASTMVAMEDALRKLESPLWPEDVLPPIDRALAKRGEALKAKPAAVVAALALAKLHHMEKSDKQGQHRQPTAEDPTADLLAYKARPLNGIWAAAPYLHNGSVPSLYALLLPPAERPDRFAVGRWEYDPKHVGYASDGQVPFVLDTSLPGNGNSNGGHEYGTKLAEEDRWALVEYLKTL